MKKYLVLVLGLMFVLSSCGSSDEEVTVSGPKWTTTSTKKSEIKDSGPANIWSANLGWGGGWAGGAWPAKKATSSVATISYKTHKTPEDCYTMVDGKVYDITKLITDYPEMSDQLASMCGEDASAFYNTKIKWSNDEIAQAILENEVK